LWVSSSNNTALIGVKASAASTIRTRLAALGVVKEDRDAILNHAPRDVGARHYDLYQRAKEKRAALDLWSDALAKILEPAPGVDLVKAGPARPRL
jgi:hypothetical protein